MSNVFTHAELNLSIQLPNCVTHSLKGQSQNNERQYRFDICRKYLTMKQISEVEGKPFTSSLNICPEKPALERGGGGRSNASPLFHHPVSLSVDISLRDDVSVILLLGVFFMYSTLYLSKKDYSITGNVVI
jgi:hypothetical protein